ncbi:hypothetical protein EMCRGX_G017345 [Ephydatia muelleri]
MPSGKHALSVFMGKFVLTAVFLLIVYAPFNYSKVQCTYGLAPTLINSAGCATQSQLDAIFNRIDADVIPLIMAAQLCLASLGNVKSNPANSCQEIYFANSSSQTGLYWVINSTGAVFQVTCRFDSFANFSSFNSNITNGFAVLTSLNMNDTTQQCPTPLKYLNSSGLRLVLQSYQTVCGKMAGYEIGSDDGFHTSSTSIDSLYVDWGQHNVRDEPKTPHLDICHWRISDSGCIQLPLYCHSNPNQPWFCNRLNASIVGDVEMRICTDEATNNEDVGLQLFEFYVQ